jgi:membrane protein YqaA with SNARE-associated domain
VDPAPAEPATTARRNPLRRLYDWVLHWAETPYGIPALFIIAIVESSVFPIPPDVLLIALALAAPTRAFRIAAWCTAGSVLGGVLGYGIGFALWATFEPLFIPAVFSTDQFERVAGLYNEWGVACVFIAGFTPIPYKVFTVSAGVAELDLLPFIGASVVGRGGRFFLVAWFIRTFGAQAKQIIDRHFNLVTIAATLMLIGGFALLKFAL